jgi:hypothetical protein
MKRECCAAALLGREYQLWQREASDSCMRPYYSYFHAVVSKGFQLLMSLLVVHDPKVLQEEWLINNELPDNLPESDACFLQEIRSKPVPLQIQCIHVIRSQLGPKSEQKLDHLPLPKSLKELYLHQITLSCHLASGLQKTTHHNTLSMT